MLTDRAKEIINNCDAKMKEAINYLEEDLKSYRVGKASPALLNSVLLRNTFPFAERCFHHHP